MLGIETIPDAANGSIALDQSTQSLDDKCNQSSRMDILFGLNAQVQSVLHLLEPLGRLVYGQGRDLQRSEDLLLHCHFVDIWR